MSPPDIGKLRQCLQLSAGAGAAGSVGKNALSGRADAAGSIGKDSLSGDASNASPRRPIANMLPDVNRLQLATPGTLQTP